MRWQHLHPELSGFEVGMPDLPNTALVLSKIDNYCEELFPQESLELERMAQPRQFGFASGRHCAHLGQQLLGLEPLPITRNKREPVWPQQCIGSITHSEVVAAAVVSTTLNGVGIDIEEAGRVDEKLYRLLFTEAEKQHISQLGADAATVIFSAKEAGYKAIYPIGRQFIGFLEAEIQIHPQTQTFSIRYLGEHAPNMQLNEGKGFWREHNGQVMTLFVLP